MLNNLFNNFNIKKNLVEKLTERNIFNPTKIQLEVIPKILAREDVIAQSKTGTGKTIAYLIPLIHLVLKEQTNLLIIAPTKELSFQIYEELLYFINGTNLKSALLIGGVDINAQIESLRNECSILIGVPGRIIKLVDQGSLKLNQIKKIVIDEADFLIDLGFIKDLERIFSLTKSLDQLMVFSATLSAKTKKILDVAHNQKYSARIDAKNKIPVNIKNYFIPISEDQRESILIKLLNSINPFLSIIFVRTKEESMFLYKKLKKANFLVGCLNGDLMPSQRKRAVNDFRKAKTQYLVATDLASRGLDVDSITHIINYTLPLNELDYLHRAGRTGRMDDNGEVYTLCNELDEGYLRKYSINLDFNLFPVTVTNNCIESIKKYKGVKPRLNLNDLKKIKNKSSKKDKRIDSKRSDKKIEDKRSNKKINGKSNYKRIDIKNKEKRIDDKKKSRSKKRR